MRKAVLQEIDNLNIVKHLIAWARYDDASTTTFLIVTKKMGDPAPKNLSKELVKLLQKDGLARYGQQYHMYIRHPDKYNPQYFAFEHIEEHDEYITHPLFWCCAEYKNNGAPRPELQIKAELLCGPVD
ncbi:hypothetical protein APHAL10511_001433 [Amanita phalloides]|nr:hypothetical protein APHAL10511_001433 [Amanita phalloides]